MQRPQHTSFLFKCINFNSLICKKILMGGFLLITLSMTASCALNKQDHTIIKLRHDSYKENEMISALLEKEQFQVGLSCEEAMKAYKLDKKTSRPNGGASIESSLLGLDENKTVKPGFFRGGCSHDQLSYVKKIISLENNTLNHEELFDAFIKQYGKPSFQKEGLNNIRYYLLFKGKFTEFSFNLLQKNNKTITIYELEDLTPKVNEK